MTLHPQTGDTIVKSDILAIKRSVRNLISTNLYERPFKPSLGLNLRGMLFELTTQDNIVLKDNIKALISSFEPRAKITEILVSDVGNDLNVTMMFTIHNDPSPQELDLVLQRVR
jgi:phage baseplate assembly protein W